jgi:transcriptional regulator with XRE-family HTH domain
MDVRSFSVWLSQSGMSVQDLSEVLDVSRAAIYKWINGENLPSAATLIKLEALSQGKVTARSFSRQDPQSPQGGQDGCES